MKHKDKFYTLTVCFTPAYVDGVPFHSWNHIFSETLTFVSDVQGDEIAFKTYRRYGSSVCKIQEGIKVFTDKDECNRIINLLVAKYRVATISVHYFNENKEDTFHCVHYPNKYYSPTFIQPVTLK